MRYWPHHHPACFCWICIEHKKPGHPSDRCHCGRCLAQVRYGLTPQRISAAQWESAVPHIEALQAAGYYVSPVGEIDGDVYVEVEEEAVGMWKELMQQ